MLKTIAKQTARTFGNDKVEEIVDQTIQNARGMDPKSLLRALPSQ